MIAGGRGRRGIDALIDALAIVAGGILCFLTVLICADVVARKTGVISLPWSLDVAEYALYVFTFFGAPWVLREGGHIAIDLFVQRLPPARLRRVRTLNHLIGAAVSATLLYYSGKVWWVSFDDGVKVHETFVFPEWWLLSFAPPIFLILLIVFVRMLLRPVAVLREPGRLKDGL